MNRGRNNLVTAELQGFAVYGEVPEPYAEHVHTLRTFEGEMVCYLKLFNGNRNDECRR